MSSIGPDRRPVSPDELAASHTRRRRRARSAVCISVVLVAAAIIALAVRDADQRADRRARIGIASPTPTGPTAVVARYEPGERGDGSFPGAGSVDESSPADGLSFSGGFHWTADRKLALVWAGDCDHVPTEVEQTAPSSMTVVTVYQPVRKAHGTHVGCVTKLLNTYVFDLPGTITSTDTVHVRFLSRTFRLSGLPAS